jgi:hypothetical protein
MIKVNLVVIVHRDSYRIGVRVKYLYAMAASVLQEGSGVRRRSQYWIDLSVQNEFL